MEIVRKQELEQLLHAIRNNPYGKYLILGIAGSGKSFLLNILGKAIEDRGIDIDYGIGNFLTATNRGLMKQYPARNTVHLIDGLDKRYNAKSIIERIKNTKECYVCTSQKDIFDIKFDYKVRLESLTNEQALLLIIDYLKMFGNDNQNIAEEIFVDIKNKNIIPSVIWRTVLSRLKSKDKDRYFLDLAANTNQLYTYGKGISISYPKIIIPEHSNIIVSGEIKNDINVITRSLIDEVANNPEILYKITPYQFEKLVCELFERNGYNVQLTKRTRDGGKDLIILNSSLLGNLVIYAECKKYAPKHPVNIGLVKELYGTVEADRATAGIMVTTSYFSRDARRFQEKIKGRMNFIDYAELISQISECN